VERGTARTSPVTFGLLFGQSKSNNVRAADRGIVHSKRVMKDCGCAPRAGSSRVTT